SSTGQKGDTVGNSHGAARDAGAGREGAAAAEAGREGAAAADQSEPHGAGAAERPVSGDVGGGPVDNQRGAWLHGGLGGGRNGSAGRDEQGALVDADAAGIGVDRSEEHTSELQS